MIVHFILQDKVGLFSFKGIQEYQQVKNVIKTIL